ncbi:MAG: hypothetical protein KatS3mg059_0271 [Thermomicrobiales bacterium]|nr:MAG: hypothetical protein KatS3mg059_0271 [Thermomicrobiales bacterium]
MHRLQPVEPPGVLNAAGVAPAESARLARSRSARAPRVPRSPLLIAPVAPDRIRRTVSSIWKRGSSPASDPSSWWMRLASTSVAIPIEHRRAGKGAEESGGWEPGTGGDKEAPLPDP